MGRSKAKYVVGIDLGTTNSAVAYANVASAKRHGGRAIKVLPIPQVVAHGEVAAEEMLPSSLYLPNEHESTDGFRLPWSSSESPRNLVGRYAQVQGVKVPGRLVNSAKSWLSYGGVDRTAAILPWGASDAVPKVSPVDASAQFLDHVVAAWNSAYPKAPLCDQDVVLTVPASFDDVARTLTVEAAKRVGLSENLVLLEEPQAAFYDYFREHTSLLAERAEEQMVLVVDVGGGTTDLTLIRVTWSHEEEIPTPVVTRVAIGDHILLGGDNMDLALAHIAERHISGQSGTLDAARMGSLIQSCRRAKEVLLGGTDSTPERFTVTIPGRGTQLIGGAKTHEFSLDDVETAVLDGFTPEIELSERPRRDGRSGLSAWGLPYASDPGITRHVAAFLNRQGDQGQPVRPDAILLNGGVFKSEGIRKRVVHTIQGWRRPEDSAAEVWSPRTFDLAVARGAATYGLVRHGIGNRVGGGAARAYYVGIHRGKKSKKQQGVCLLPRHVETGQAVQMKDRVFQLVLGRPVRFSLFATTADKIDDIGALVDLTDESFLQLPPIQTVLETEEDVTELPVTLRAELSEVGILQVWAQSVDRDTRYQLDFSLRALEREPDAAAETPAQTKAMDGKTRDAIETVVRRTYGKPRKDVDPREIKWIRKSLEETLDTPRADWSAPTCRAVWDLLKVGIRRRRRSERHESTFFHLTGFCLRPGFGDSFDQWRMGEVWKLYESGIHFSKDAETWNAWWIMWRRIAGGLDAEAQSVLLDGIEHWLRPSKAARNQKRPRYLGPEEAARLIGALERVDAQRKTSWGDWFLEQVRDPKQSGRPAWCLARLGARQPFYGSSHQVVSIPVATRWVEEFLAMDWRRVGNAALAAASIARLTGDRARDLELGLRERVASRLLKSSATAHMAQWVQEVVELSAKDESQFLGDSLPEGLKLVVQ